MRAERDGLAGEQRENVLGDFLGHHEVAGAAAGSVEDERVEPIDKGGEERIGSAAIDERRQQGARIVEFRLWFPLVRFHDRFQNK